MSPTVHHLARRQPLAASVPAPLALPHLIHQRAAKSRATVRATCVVTAHWAHDTTPASLATRAILSSGQANSAGPQAEMPALCGNFAIFYFCLYFQKIVET
jgi:hypothetical protein